MAVVALKAERLSVLRHFGQHLLHGSLRSLVWIGKHVWPLVEAAKEGDGKTFRRLEKSV